MKDFHPTAKILLQLGRERSLLRRHPWVFSGAIDGISGDPKPGETVDVYSADKEWLGRGAFSPASQITVRMWTFDEKEAVDEAFFLRRLSAAIALRCGRMECLRRKYLEQGWCHALPAARLVHGEGDGLPGLVLDRYANVIIGQFLTAGMEYWKPTIVQILRQIYPECSVYERSDVSVRKHEDLPLTSGLLAGEEPPALVDTQWGGFTFQVDVRHGHKTGAYLDQADALPRVQALAHDADVLDTFCYTGGFTLAALRGGAKKVTCVDSSADALAALSKNVTLNNLDSAKTEPLCADVFETLRSFRDRGKTFDLIILDPPKFADSKSTVERACRAYKDINLLAFKLLNPGGRLATFSCSGSVTPELFQKVVADAAVDARRFARMTDRFMQSADHPVCLAFPEGLYLKGLLCTVN